MDLYWVSYQLKFDFIYIFFIVCKTSTVSIMSHEIQPLIMDISPSQLLNFGEVWKELLKQKVGIIFTIANEKNVSFKGLLNEFIPEAFDNKDLWESNYILDNDESGSSAICNTIQPPKKKLTIKKISSKSISNNPTDIVSELGSMEKVNVQTKTKIRIKKNTQSTKTIFIKKKVK